jgi:DNA-binding CsgD family transcriptional regulator
MDESLVRIAEQNSVEKIIRAAKIAAYPLGVKAGTFHLTAPHASQTGPKVVIAAFGYDREWVTRYRDPKIRKNDPVPDHVMRTGRVMTYAEALTELTSTPAQSAFVESCRAIGMIEAMAMPIYGPFDFDTFATFSLGRPFGPEDAGIVNRIVAIVEVSNRRIAQVLENRTAIDIPLSDREAEVLHWIGLSKSNGDIATILAISPATIDTYVRRLFAKLGVNDRIAAAVQGIRLGLIRY